MTLDTTTDTTTATTRDLIEVMRRTVSLADQRLLRSLDRAGYPAITPGQLKMLEMVADGVGSPSDLTAAFGTTPQYVSKNLHLLDADGCVDTDQAAVDRRRHQFRATQRGTPRCRDCSRLENPDSFTCHEGAGWDARRGT